MKGRAWVSARAVAPMTNHRPRSEIGALRCPRRGSSPTTSMDDQRYRLAACPRLAVAICTAILSWWQAYRPARFVAVLLSDRVRPERFSRISAARSEQSVHAFTPDRPHDVVSASGRLIWRIPPAFCLQFRALYAQWRSHRRYFAVAARRKSRPPPEEGRLKRFAQKIRPHPCPCVLPVPSASRRQPSACAAAWSAARRLGAAHVCCRWSAE